MGTSIKIMKTVKIQWRSWYNTSWVCVRKKKTEGRDCPCWFEFTKSTFIYPELLRYECSACVHAVIWRTPYMVLTNTGKIVQWFSLTCMTKLYSASYTRNIRHFGGRALGHLILCLPFLVSVTIGSLSEPAQNNKNIWFLFMVRQDVIRTSSNCRNTVVVVLLNCNTTELLA